MVVLVGQPKGLGEGRRTLGPKLPIDGEIFSSVHPRQDVVLIVRGERDQQRIRPIDVDLSMHCTVAKAHVIQWVLYESGISAQMLPTKAVVEPIPLELRVTHQGKLNLGGGLDNVTDDVFGYREATDPPISRILAGVVTASFPSADNVEAHAARGVKDEQNSRFDPLSRRHSGHEQTQSKADGEPHTQETLPGGTR